MLILYMIDSKESVGIGKAEDAEKGNFQNNEYLISSWSGIFKLKIYLHLQSVVKLGWNCRSSISKKGENIAHFVDTIYHIMWYSHTSSQMNRAFYLHMSYLQEPFPLFMSRESINRSGYVQFWLSEFFLVYRLDRLKVEDLGKILAPWLSSLVCRDVSLAWNVSNSCKGYVCTLFGTSNHINWSWKDVVHKTKGHSVVGKESASRVLDVKEATRSALVLDHKISMFMPILLSVYTLLL